MSHLLARTHPRTHPPACTVRPACLCCSAAKAKRERLRQAHFAPDYVPVPGGGGAGGLGGLGRLRAPGGAGKGSLAAAAAAEDAEAQEGEQGSDEEAEEEERMRMRFSGGAEAAASGRCAQQGVGWGGG